MAILVYLPVTSILAAVMRTWLKDCGRSWFDQHWSVSRYTAGTLGSEVLVGAFLFAGGSGASMMVRG